MPIWAIFVFLCGISKPNVKSVSVDISEWRPQLLSLSCSGCRRSLPLLLQPGALNQTERLHELVDVYAAVFVEVDAEGQVWDGLVGDVGLQVGAQKLPSLTELLEWDETL